MSDMSLLWGVASRRVWGAALEAETVDNAFSSSSSPSFLLFAFSILPATS